MAKRTGLSKKLRFEVFKRDSFRCQYCGRSAPDVTLQADHIHPVSKGGVDDILNLITSCSDCNAGKSDRELSDGSVLAKQMAQLADLNERREQLEMMIQWRDGLKDIDDEKVEHVVRRIYAIAPGWKVNESGRSVVRKWIKTIPFQDILQAIDDVADHRAAKGLSSSTHDEWHELFDDIPRFAKVVQKCRENPHAKRLYYIRALLRRRCDDLVDYEVMPLLERYAKYYDIDWLQKRSYETTRWKYLRERLEGLCERAESGRKGEG